MGWLSQVVNVHNLCKVSKTKYLAVSPVTDNSEQLDKDVNGGLNIPNSHVKFEGWTRVGDCGFHAILVSWLNERSLQKIGKFWLYAK